MHLNTKDLLAFRATGNKQIARVCRQLNKHLIRKFQVALWQMQRNINFFDATDFKTIQWPLEITNLFVFVKLFSDHTKFARDILHIYCPLATIYEQRPRSSDTTYHCVQRMYAISGGQLTQRSIVDFVDVAFGALDGLTNYADPAQMSRQHFMLGDLTDYVAKGLYRDEYLQIMDYVHAINELREAKDPDVCCWFKAHRKSNVYAHSTHAMIRQAIERTSVLESIMANVSQLAITTSSFRYIIKNGESLLSKYPRLQKLRCDLRRVYDVVPLISYLAETNQIEEVEIHGRNCVDCSYSIFDGMFAPFRQYSRLSTITFQECHFLTDNVLGAIVPKLQKVIEFYCRDNVRTTRNGIMRALELQHREREQQIYLYQFGAFGEKMPHKIPTRIILENSWE